VVDAGVESLQQPVPFVQGFTWGGSSANQEDCVRRCCRGNATYTTVLL
jgi:hypothetical protein